MNKYLAKKDRCLRKRLMTLFAALMVLFGASLSASAATTLEVRNVDRVRIVTFDPAKNRLVLFSAKEQGFPEGAQISHIFKNTKAEVAINAGFFDRGPYGNPDLLEKIKEKFFDPSNAGYAFPSAILMSKKKLLSDTDNYLPAVGINEAGEIKFGEVKVVWYASCFKNGSRLQIDRSTKMDVDTTDAVIYLKDENDKSFMEVSLSDGVVSNIRLVPEIACNKKLNSFYVHNPSADAVSELKSIKQGDNISITYELKAAVYTATGEANSEDPELSAFFNSCSDVVSGGQLLIYNGEVDPRGNKMYPGRAAAYEKFGTAICIHKGENPKVSLMVDTEGSLMSGGRIAKDDFIALVKKENCEQVLSLDGGKSSGMITDIDGKYEVVGRERIISDVLAILPGA